MAAMDTDDGRAAQLELEAGGNRARIIGGLARRLEDHQVFGVRWLYAAYHAAHRGGWHGCILGDGMGVGKTLQTIAVVHALLESCQCTRAMIVVPSTLVSNWRNEVAKFATPPHVETALPVMFVGEGAQCSTARRALAALRDAVVSLYAVVSQVDVACTRDGVDRL